jgi:dihydrofolate synthase/folylpolyglutamate synthase
MRRFESLEAWLDWQQALHPRLIDLGLERVRRVLARTAYRGPRQPVFTVGGTNGKGSCVAMLDAILRAAGYRVGTFTSPHLVDYRERVRIDGRWISAASLVAAFERIADALGDDTLTFFEFNTLAALLVFETAEPDAIVLEVGMGGRLDAVNVVDADCAIVVSIGLDHMEWLGQDVEQIAGEKAGIFRGGRPAIFGSHAVPRAIVGRAGEIGAHLLLRGRDFDASPRPDGAWDYRGRHRALDGLPAPALQGNAQPGNAATVIAALDELSSRLTVPREAIESGLRETRLAGRFQVVRDRRGFEWVLDVAHNPDAARLLGRNLASSGTSDRTIAVCGMLSDKDAASVLGEMQDAAARWIAASTCGPRGMTDSMLAERARSVGLQMETGGEIRDALRFAAGIARPGDRVVVFGSFLTVGPALEWLVDEGVLPRDSW